MTKRRTKYLPFQTLCIPTWCHRIVPISVDVESGINSNGLWTGRRQRRGRKRFQRKFVEKTANGSWHTKPVLKRTRHRRDGTTTDNSENSEISALRAYLDKNLQKNLRKLKCKITETPFTQRDDQSRAEG